MNPNKPIYHLALLTLEACSAHGVRSGQGELVHDVVLLRDANGLPALPGTSVAGVLRHLYRQHYGVDATNTLFGSIDAEQATSSAVEFTWGLVHDSHNAVQEGLRETVSSDALLAVLARPHPIVRQRVRLDARGTVSDMGKFDVSLIPAGTRYSALIGYWSDGSNADEQAWQQLLSLLYSPLFRIGHGTRAGAGVFSVQALHAQRWDLRCDTDRHSYLQRPRSRMAARALPVYSAAPLANEDALKVVLSVRSEAGWRIGGGDSRFGFTDDETPDLLPQSEVRVQWAQQRAQISERFFLLPATAIKGALVHRFAFHYRCLTGNWVKAMPSDAHDETAVKEVFGYAGDKDDEGQAGLVFIEDVYLDEAHTTTATQMHNRIDHFTGGVMTGALFEEGLLWQSAAVITIHFAANERLQQLSSTHRQALCRTLDDLGAGRLPLGASGSRGQGVFVATQEPQWSDNGTWIQHKELA